MPVVRTGRRRVDGSCLNWNDGRRQLWQDKDSRGRPDKLSRVSHHLAQRTFGWIVIGRQMVARRKTLIRFSLGWDLYGVQASGNR